ncbi:sigma-54-dependent transcriptional regulator [Stieleria magnilauensis]|uniref:Transcriptional regulatory protein ZraR n=1 Tax=Stieleria magnilauensis TaxID=2527963 RepID=A0ABX5XZ28_9BACT|nr:Transcriptional regulatory protein ZraR [Planctomycetes bacterium TBK1r]
MERKFNLLIVDDEPNLRSGLARGLSKVAGTIETAASVNEGLDKFDAGNFQLVITDVRMPGDRDGLELISWIQRRKPGTTTIVITAHGSMETAVDAMRRGAFDFISKPVDLELIRQQVSRAFKHHQLQDENHELKEKLAAVGEIGGIVGNSQTLEELLIQIRQVASTDATVMIQGESGTGKELIAKAIHDQSNRSAGPFIPVNLGALPESLLESELFGHEQGSFTGASRQKPGFFEQSIGGTLFLDEITEIPAKSQVDLLRVLESQTYKRVGGEREQSSDARIVSASNRDVSKMLAEGTFREDLFYRLNIVPIHVPPLRSRRGDVPLLVEYFLDHFCKRHGRPLKSVDADAMQLFINARWPGNVRQLRNVIERIVVTSANDLIRIGDLPEELSRGEGQRNHSARTLIEITETAEKSGIEDALAANDSHREQTAKSLGISVRTLHYKMKKYDLH